VESGSLGWPLHPLTRPLHGHIVSVTVWAAPLWRWWWGLGSGVVSRKIGPFSRTTMFHNILMELPSKSEGLTTRLKWSTGLAAADHQAGPLHQHHPTGTTPGHDGELGGAHRGGIWVQAPQLSVAVPRVPCGRTTFRVTRPEVLVLVVYMPVSVMTSSRGLVCFSGPRRFVASAQTAKKKDASHGNGPYARGLSI